MQKWYSEKKMYRKGSVYSEPIYKHPEESEVKNPKEIYCCNYNPERVDCVLCYENIVGKFKSCFGRIL